MELKPGGRPAPDVQRRYALWLERGARAGLLLLVGAFAAYLSGALAPHVPIERLPELWSLPAHRYLEEARLAPGWGWAAALPASDLMTLAGIALLAGCSLLPLAAAAWAFRARGQRALAWVCVLQVAVLLLAASGVVTVGH